LIKAATYAAIVALSMAGTASAQEAITLDCAGTLRAKGQTSGEPLHTIVRIDLKAPRVTLDAGWSAEASIAADKIVFAQRDTDEATASYFGGTVDRVTGEISAVTITFVRDRTADRWLAVTEKTIQLFCKPLKRLF
jgi:hypothetical protein